MPSTYTSLLRLTLPADGELIGTWGQVVNNGITTLAETAIAGTSAIALADANRTLTTANGATDEARNMVISFTGALTAQRDIIVPSVSKIYFIRNGTTGGFGLNVKTAAGTGVVVPASTSMLVYCNGTNVLTAITSLVGTGQFLADDGTVALPSYSFLNDPNTGIYRASADEIDFSSGGVQRFVIATTNIQVRPSLTASSPSLVVGAGTNAVGPGYGIDITGSGVATDYARIRLLNNGYSIERMMLATDSGGAYMATPGALPLVFATTNIVRFTIAAGGDATYAGSFRVTGALAAAPNFWVGETAAAAGTVGISGALGASAIFWGNSSAGVGKLDIYTGGGAALIFPRVASAVNYFEMHQGAAGFGPGLKVVGADTNLQFNYYAQGGGSHAFWINSQAHVVIAYNPGTNRYLSLTGGVSANPGIGDSFAQGVRISNCSLQVIGAGRPWGGVAVTESQGYVYNVALGICNMTAAANQRIHEWYKDATKIYGLWISDNGGAAVEWLSATGGTAGTTAINFTTTGTMQVTANTGLKVTSSNVLDGFTITDAGANGAHIKMASPSLATPNKYIRAQGASWEVVNSGYTAVLFAVNESGALSGLGGRHVAWKTWDQAAVEAIGTSAQSNSFYVLGASTTIVTAPQGTFYRIVNTAGASRTITASGITIVLSGNTAAITVVTIPARGECTVFYANATYAQFTGVGCTGA